MQGRGTAGPGACTTAMDPDGEEAEERVTMHTRFLAFVQYPSEGYHETLEASTAALAEATPETGALLQGFAAFARGRSIEELQELFTGTFDMDPDCSLDLGWHLFGEDRKRGVFLVKLRKELSQHGLTETTELPDHLTHILRLLEKMDAGEAARFAVTCVIPAVQIVTGTLEKRESPFTPVFQALLAFLEEAHRSEPRKADDGQEDTRESGNFPSPFLALKGNEHA